ncbi:MAG: glycosyltransferase family 4 protein [Candidatus Rokubacteria bacterium]|nr:glycosyltransferase family 4 protein [Candidatus Rokubacteria bacterium]
MKLLIIARPFVFHGGVERATAGLLQALVEHGYDVHLLSPRGRQAMPGVTHHPLPLPPLPSAARVLALAAAARLAVARSTWDVVQSHERTLRQDVYRAGEGCHRAYLASLGDHPRGRAVYHRIVLALERRVFAVTPAIVAIARRGADEIASLYGVAPTRISVVYNGVDLDRFHPRNRALHRAAARAEAGIPAEAFALLFIGNGFERKGLATLLEALARVPGPTRRLIVIGKGDRRPFEAQAARLGLADRLVWLGLRPDVERWYAAADVVALPSRYEPFGNVHLEALASGVPVVTSAAAGGAEVIQQGLNGAIVDPHDSAALAAALERLRGQPQARLAEAARRSAEPFTFAAQVAGFARIYRSIRGATCDFS